MLSIKNLEEIRHTKLNHNWASSRENLYGNKHKTVHTFFLAHRIRISEILPCLWGMASYTGTDQTAHPRSLISAFIICILESIICILAASEISS